MRSLKLATQTLRRFCTNKGDRLKQLREITGAPLMKCKEAIDKFSTLEEAKAYLREKNLVMAEKKAGNVASEGVLTMSVLPDKLLVAKVNSETDFVAKNQEFLNFVQETIKTLANNTQELKTGSNELQPETLKKINAGDSDLLEKQKMITAKIQENIRICEVFVDTFDPSHTVGTYIHKALRDNVGTSLGYVVVDCKGQAPKPLVQEMANDLAVHIFCKSPTYISFDTIAPEVVEAKVQEIKSTLDDSFKKKPKEIQEKIMEGKIGKAFDDEILYDQIADFWDSEKKISDYLKDFETSNNAQVKVIKFNSLKIK